MKEMIEVYKALSDETRLTILNLLKNGELCSCAILEKLQCSQSTLSHHIKLLKNANLVNCRKDGKWVHLSLNQNTLNLASDYLKAIQFNDKQNECNEVICGACNVK